jgi:hypothetical protein
VAHYNAKDIQRISSSEAKQIDCRFKNILNLDYSYLFHSKKPILYKYIAINKICGEGGSKTSYLAKDLTTDTYVNIVEIRIPKKKSDNLRTFNELQT